MMTVEDISNLLTYLTYWNRSRRFYIIIIIIFFYYNMIRVQAEPSNSQKCIKYEPKLKFDEKYKKKLKYTCLKHTESLSHNHTR